MTKFKSLTLFFLAIIVLTSCKKSEKYPPVTEVNTDEILYDFAHVLVYPNYLDIKQNADILNQKVESFFDAPAQTKLEEAQEAWRNLRKGWELSEAYLFGPVEDFDYDPRMDEWPVNHVDMDSLLSSSYQLNAQSVEELPNSLKGFHPLEYMLFGLGGTRKHNELNSRMKDYTLSLSKNLTHITDSLQKSWKPGEDNFNAELLNAGKGHSRFASKREAFTAIVQAMINICEEVADGKMEEPFVAQDSSLEESQFAHNSTLDFKHNLQGVLNAYLCKYKADGHGLNELVASKNLSLDQKLQSQMNAAINSFDHIDANYGKAIFEQPIQITNTQKAIRALANTLETDLLNFLIMYVQD